MARINTTFIAELAPVGSDARGAFNMAYNNTMQPRIDFDAVRLEIKPVGDCCGVATGYAVFKIGGKQYRRKLVDRRHRGESRYFVRFANQLWLVPYNVPSITQGAAL